MGMVSLQSEVEPHIAPLCSVCIANFNGEQLIEQCIESVLKQEGFPGAIEIIIHDDASTDNSVNIIKRRYPLVTLLLSETNVGFCVSNNRMVAVAKGEYILLLNNDAVLFPDALSALHTHTISQTLQGIISLPQYDLLTHQLVDRGCLLDLFYNPVPNKDPKRQDVAMVIGACLWLPRNLWLELGGFPEWMESIAEDMYLCCLARFRGYPVQVSKTSGYLHIQGRSFGGNRIQSFKLCSTFRRRILSERNKTFIMILFTPKYLLLVLLLMHAIWLSIEGILLSILRLNHKIWTNIYLNVFWSIKRDKAIIIQKRKDVQENRKSSIIYFFSTFKLIPQKLIMLLRYGIPKIQ